MFLPSLLAGPAEGREPAGLVVRCRESSKRRLEADVAKHTIIHCAARQKLPAGCAESRMSKGHRDGEERRIPIIDPESASEHATSELLVLNHQLVCETRCIEIELIRVVYAQHDIERTASEPETANLDVAELYERLLEASQPYRRTTAQRHGRHCSHQNSLSHFIPPRSPWHRTSLDR